MAFNQIALDFGDLPQKPKPENILIPEKKVLPKKEILPAIEDSVQLEEFLDLEALPEVAIVTEMEVVLEKKVASPQQKLPPKFSSNKQAIKISVEKTKSTRGRKSVKEMSEGVALIEVPEDDILFQKMYYTIGKVADMFKVNQSLIRLWENEFDVLKPKKMAKAIVYLDQRI